MIYAIALSPNEEYLAVGGFLDKPGDHPVGQIRIYNYKSGKLLKILRSHENVVLDLAFSSDNRYLTSASADTTVKIWDISSLGSEAKTMQKGGELSIPLPKTISFHTNAVYAVKFIKKGGNEFVVSAGYDNQIALHSMGGEMLKSYTHSEKLQYLATNDNEIAACGQGNEILIFDNKLNLKQTIKSETVPKGLAYSPDKRYLIAGQNGTPENVNIYDSYYNYKKIQSFDKHTNLTMAVAFLDNTI